MLRVNKGESMPILEVTLTQSFQNQECVNRWTYVASGTPASVSFSFALTNALGAIETAGVYPASELMRLIAAVQSNAVTFQTITVKDIYSVTDFYSTPFTSPLAGVGAGEFMAPFVAYGFRTNRIRSDVARATKRFVGVLEANYSGTAYIGAVITALEAISAKMSANLEFLDEGNTLTFIPAVCGKEKYDPNPTSPDANHVAYRYYATESEQLAHTAQGVLWQHYPNVRSQVSRQLGRGR